MSDDEITKVFSVPPPPTDEIDSQWNLKAGTAEQVTATKAAEQATAPASDSGSPRVDAQLKEQLAGQAETAAAPATPPPAAISDQADDRGEDEDDEDGEDEDDEDGEDEDEVLAAAAHAPVAPPAHSDSTDDWLPDWAPWLLLGLLITLGLAGGLGLFTHPAAQTEAAPTAVAERGPTPSAPTSIEASHFLVQYQGSMRAPATITRTKDEAKKRAEEGLAKVRGGADFAMIVGEYSDEPGAGARGGALGSFTRETMIKQFSDVAFELKVNQVSGVIETPFGFHVIKRTK